MMLIVKRGHRLLYIGLVVVFFVLVYPLLYLTSRKVSRFNTLNHVRRFYAYVSSLFAGFLFRYRYEAAVDWSKTYVICANHTSNLDIPVITCAVKGNFAFMGKDELLQNPLLGFFFKTIDIPINRESRISAFRAFKKAAEYIQQGMSVVIFPEGKIGDEFPPVLHDFKNGPFRLAVEHQVPILPITIIDNWTKMWDDGLKYGTRPGISDIWVHSPINTVGLTVEDVDNLRDKVYSIIKSKL
jgi:1-acyl-sn-glycerol-3-phosphate acyltransferase